MDSMDRFLEDGEEWMFPAENREDIARRALDKDTIEYTTRLKAQAEFMEEYGIPAPYPSTPVDAYVEGEEYATAWNRYVLYEYTKAARRVAEDVGWDKVEKVNTNTELGWKILYATINGRPCRLYLTVPKKLSCRKVPVTDENGEPVMEEKDVPRVVYVKEKVQKYEVECKPLLAGWGEDS